jgi:PPM family protein phosphatase
MSDGGRPATRESPEDGPAGDPARTFDERKPIPGILAERMRADPGSGLTRPVAAGLTDVGRQRKHNEDDVLLLPEHRLYAVADGMGGHNAGDVASKLTTTSLRNYFESTGDPGATFPADEYESLDPGARRLAAGIRKANLDVFTISSTVAQHRGMGSTIVAAHVGDDDRIYIGHVGDSRCYRIRDGIIEKMTRDHSLINDALDLKPDLSPEELARLPRNIITRALGMKDVVKVDIRSEPIRLGDIFVLCSDGLSGMVSDQQMLEVIQITSDPQEACELLVAEANDAGGTDNISALIVRIDEAEVESVDSSPDVEVSSSEETVDEEESPISHLRGDAVAEMTRLLAAGAEVDLELHGPWSTRGVPVRLCKGCQHELYPGNSFCVECGLRIEP